MASPLRKRFPRELKNNLGKYLGIFLLMSVTIALTSGFLLAAHSIAVIIDDMPEKYSIEDARFTTAFEATDEQLDAASAAATARCASISIAPRLTWPHTSAAACPRPPTRWPSTACSPRTTA